jgi:hypothetical protein
MKKEDEELSTHAVNLSTGYLNMPAQVLGGCLVHGSSQTLPPALLHAVG